MALCLCCLASRTSNWLFFVLRSGESKNTGAPPWHGKWWAFLGDLAGRCPKGQSDLKKPEQPPLLASLEKRSKNSTVVPQGDLEWPVMLPGIMELPESPKPHSSEAVPSSKLTCVPNPSAGVHRHLLWPEVEDLSSSSEPPLIQMLGFFSQAFVITQGQDITCGSSCQCITCRPKACLSALERPWTLSTSRSQSWRCHKQGGCGHSNDGCPGKTSHQEHKLQYVPFNLKWWK